MNKIHKASELISNVKSGLYDRALLELCVDTEQLSAQKERYVHALTQFISLYGDLEAEVYSAPGRTEIGGNHTDHQNGRVLAAAINLDTIAIVSKTDDQIVRMQSEGYEACTVDMNSLEKHIQEEGTTNALIRGVAHGIHARGYLIGGFQAYVTSSVLSGSGLSSSAAFEILVGTVFSGLYNHDRVSPSELAVIGQEAENQYFGKPCGLMDQMASACGGMTFIDFSGKPAPVVKKLTADFKQFQHCLCIVDTKGSHADLTDEYASIPAEMKAVAGYFGHEILGQVDEKAFFDQISQIRSLLGDRAVLRAIHWFEENRRVDFMTEALESGDFDRFKNMIQSSGDSSYKYLQNVYTAKDIRVQNLSLALALSDRILGEHGVSRVHGGGFAGTIQAFVPVDRVMEYRAAMQKIFGENSCYSLQIRSSGGKRVF